MILQVTGMILQVCFLFFFGRDAQPTWLEVVVPRATAAERPVVQRLNDSVNHPR